MLARRSKLDHPLIGEVELPLLVPAFSSKGSGLARKRGANSHDFSYAAPELAEFGRHPSNSVLVSAYDLHFQHFEAPGVKPKNPVEHLRNAALVFMDSGGYELSSELDDSEPKQYQYAPKQGFGKRQYEAILRGLASLDEPLPLVISNFDHCRRARPIKKQIQEARKLFERFPDSLHTLIIRAPQKGADIDPEDITRRDYKNLTASNIDVVGVTEKELGLHLVDRLKRIAQLRCALDEAGASAPLHIWGGLDPIVTPLYFFAGAEIFDGLSWLRYTFVNGIAVSRTCSEVMLPDLGISANKAYARQWAAMSNRLFMENLRAALQQWCDAGSSNFDMFNEHVRHQLRKAYSGMRSQIPQIGGRR